MPNSFRFVTSNLFLKALATLKITEIMSGIGAELPPHLLAKRKRQQEEQASVEPTITSGAKRSPSPDGPEKRRRVIGPAMPPAPLDQRPEEPPNADDDSSSDDDDFGPSLPTDDAPTGHVEADSNDNSLTGAEPAPPEKLKRDDWMTMAPKQDDLAARMDPLVQRPRAFNTGKGARAPAAGGDDNSTWHETPEQKRKRLADEMMGIGAPSAGARPQPAKASRENEAHRKIKEHVDKTRGPSLMDQHTKATKDKETEDDPSKRAFDREKDMGHGGRMSSVQKKEMLNKAAGFSGKFSGGSYL